MDFSSVPVLGALPVDEIKQMLSRAERVHLETDKVLVYEGDASEFLYVLVVGECALSFGDMSRGTLTPFSIVDPVSVWGGLPYSVKVTTKSSCEFLRWTVSDLMSIPAFAIEARRYLARELQVAQTRRDELAAPLHLLPGPFYFENVTMIFAFCEGKRDSTENMLPDGLSLLQRPIRNTAPVLVVLAKFPIAYPEGRPDARFSYTETTFFVPVRYQTAFGFYVPAIYPSTYEPIFAGRDIYGFPKRLGETAFLPNATTLAVDNAPLLDLAWEGGEGSDETRLVRGLFDWLGIQGRLASMAFQAGEVLRKAVRLPAYRRVDVYNHKRLPAVDTSIKEPRFVVDQLTRATFGVLRWYQIAKLKNPLLTIHGGELGNLTLREAYRTQLDMRLSTGRVVTDYLSG